MEVFRVLDICSKYLYILWVFIYLMYTMFTLKNNFFYEFLWFDDVYRLKPKIDINIILVMFNYYVFVHF